MSTTAKRAYNHPQTAWSEAHAQAVLQFERFCNEHNITKVRCRLVMLKCVRDSYCDVAAPRRALIAMRELHRSLQPTILYATHCNGILTVAIKDHLQRECIEHYIAELF